MVWNCQRLIGISPGEVFLVRANNLMKSRWMALATAIGCCVTTATLETVGHGLDRHARRRLVTQQRAGGIADQAIDAQCGHHLR